MLPFYPLSRAMPQVSVIIPTWNRRESLARAIGSVLAQRDVSVEVLVCDDDSDDGTREMVAGWSDDRVRLLTGPRAGMPAIPRNRGLAVARGDWFAFLDDDDEWFPHKLRAQLEATMRHNLLAGCSNAIRKAPTRGDAPYFSSLPEVVTFPCLIRNNFVIASSAMFHRSLLPQVGGFPESRRHVAIEDYALWLRVASLTSFACVVEPLLVYRDDPVASIRSRNTSGSSNLCAVYSDWLFWAGQRASSLQRALALRRYLSCRFPRPAAFFHRAAKHIERATTGCRRYDE
jgi:glycosyltransferase involved in cell wall biosynthesis